MQRFPSARPLRITAGGKTGQAMWTSIKCCKKGLVQPTEFVLLRPRN